MELSESTRIISGEVSGGVAIVLMAEVDKKGRLNRESKVRFKCRIPTVRRLVANQRWSALKAYLGYAHVELQTSTGGTVWLDEEQAPRQRAGSRREAA